MLLLKGLVKLDLLENTQVVDQILPRSYGQLSYTYLLSIIYFLFYSLKPFFAAWTGIVFSYARLFFVGSSDHREIVTDLFPQGFRIGSLTPLGRIIKDNRSFVVWWIDVDHANE